MYLRNAVATGRSAAGCTRSLRSRQKVSLVRLSGAATCRLLIRHPEVHSGRSWYVVAVRYRTVLYSILITVQLYKAVSIYVLTLNQYAYTYVIQDEYV